MEVRCYLPNDMLEKFNKRCVELGLSKSEYLRTLAELDLTTQTHKKVLRYSSILEEQILGLEEKLGITPDLFIPNIPFLSN